VFAELAEMVGRYGAVEIALKDNRVLVNGSLDGLDATSAKNLVDRMALHKIGGLLFCRRPTVMSFSPVSP
jgi:hypothetical protein